MNNYVELAEQNYNKHCFETYNGHIDSCKIVWCRDDVHGTAKNMNVELSEDEVDEVLYLLVHKHDATIGVTWETIEYWIDEIVKDREGK